MILVCERNTRALNILYDRYGKSVYNFILRYTNNKEISEDLLQETFTRLWFASHTFNPAKGTFKGWLFTIGINLTRNEMSRKRYGYQYVDLDEGDEIDDSKNDYLKMPAADLLEQADLKDTIGKALERLNPFLKEVIILKHFQKLKFSEISEMTNTPEGTLKARFHNALYQLKQLLQKAEF